MRLGVGTHLELTPGFEALNWRHTQAWLEEAPKTRAVGPPAAVVAAAAAAADEGSRPALSPAPGAVRSATGAVISATGAVPSAAPSPVPSAPATSAAAAAASVAGAMGGLGPNSCEARLWPDLQVRMPRGTYVGNFLGHSGSSRWDAGPGRGRGGASGQGRAIQVGRKRREPGFLPSAAMLSTPDLNP